jgi:selenide,water dikinase
VTHPDLVVGLGTADDAGVFLVPGSPERALVQTVDFFTPIVDDPGDWGRIAAANALSDVYAMGGSPLTALQLLGWPRDTIPFEVATQVLRGGADKMVEAGCVIVGGHSIDDAEPTFGFAVTGMVAVSEVVTNAGARPGDSLVLTKPLGSGVVATAHKAGRCPPDVLEEMVDVMARLNRVAGEALASHGAHAATDVTGFGLLGHLLEMVDASGVGAEVQTEAVPVVEGVRGLWEEGFYPGGSRRNLEAIRARVGGESPVLPLLADAQTSGGLLVALPPDRVEGYVEAVPGATVIGRVTDRPGTLDLT